MGCVHRYPAAGELWLSRPPYMFLTRVLATDIEGQPHIEYVLHDDDGEPLTGPIREVLDDSWWRNFQPLDRRYG